MFVELDFQTLSRASSWLFSSGSDGLLQAMDICQVISKSHLILERLLAHEVNTGIHLHYSEMFFDVISELIASFPVPHTLRRLSGLVTQAEGAMARPNERMAISDDFAPSGRGARQMNATMALSLAEGIELKALVAVLHFPILAT